MPTSSVDLLGEAAHSSVVLLGGGPLPTSSVVLLGGGPLPTSSVVLLCASRLYISAQSSFIYLAVIPAFVSATQDGAGSPPPLVEVNQAILAWSIDCSKISALFGVEVLYCIIVVLKGNVVNIDLN
jgi:hypothetical protein